jgi:hypothetical protein
VLEFRYVSPRKQTQKTELKQESNAKKTDQARNTCNKLTRSKKHMQSIDQKQDTGTIGSVLAAKE